jgi:hypothetical protein
MSFLKPGPLLPQQIERREHIRLKGRNHYIVVRGILCWGMPTFLLTSVWKWYDHAWHVPARGELFFQVLIGLVLWTAGGYWLVAVMWQRFIEEPDRKSTWA